MNALRNTLQIARALAMALWVGAMAGFAFLYAPIAFQALGPVPAFAAMIADTLRALTVFGWACAAFALIATLPLAKLAKRPSLLVAALVVAMVCLSWYEYAAIIPQMEKTTLLTPAYEALHKTSSEIYGAVLLLGIATIGLLFSSRCR